MFKRLTKSVLILLIKVFLLFISICCITTLRSLVYLSDVEGYRVKDFGFYPQNYGEAIYETFIHLFSIYNLTYRYSGHEYHVFPDVLNKYVYTMVVLFSALLVTILVSFFFSYVFLFFSQRFKRIFKALLIVLDSIPDIIIILASQLFVIRLYQTTGLKFLQLYGINGKVYLLPILCLSFVPVVMLIKITINIFEEELEEHYVEFAIAKGLSRSTVLFKHVTRNVLKSLLSHIGMIYWYMLSSLFIIEYLFFMQGFTPLLFRVNSSSLSSFAIIMLLIPFGLIKAASFMLYERSSLQDEE